jgi:hypothetical protein
MYVKLWKQQNVCPQWMKWCDHPRRIQNAKSGTPLCVTFYVYFVSCCLAHLDMLRYDVVRIFTRKYIKSKLWRFLKWSIMFSLIQGKFFLRLWRKKWSVFLLTNSQFWIRLLNLVLRFGILEALVIVNSVILLQTEEDMCKYNCLIRLLVLITIRTNARALVTWKGKSLRSVIRLNE